jgi:hypothetical protein
MVYLDPTELKWLPRVKTWLQIHSEKLKPPLQALILNLFETYVEDGFIYLKKNCEHIIAQVSYSHNIPLDLLSLAFTFLLKSPNLYKACLLSINCFHIIILKQQVKLVI